MKEKDRKKGGKKKELSRLRGSSRAVMTRSASPEQSSLGKERAYPPALEEVQRRSHVGQPVDPSELAALLARLWRFFWGGGGEGRQIRGKDQRGKVENKEKEHFTLRELEVKSDAWKQRRAANCESVINIKSTNAEDEDK